MKKNPGFFGMDKETKQLLGLATPLLNKAGPGRLEHTLRVLRIAEYLAKKEKADLQVVKFAAILHDIGKYKESEEKRHAAISAEMSSNILDQFNLSDENKKKIIQAISIHSKYTGNKTMSIEDKIIQDADKLDRLSAVRIGSFFYMGAIKKINFSNIITKIKNWINNNTNYNTKSAKQLSKEKLKFCRNFISTFEKEWIDINEK